MDIECSPEQRKVIECLQDHNVIVDSVAGSGKTTCNIFIAQTYATKKILLLTYNSKLKIETREKVIKYNIKNLEVHSFHSFCVKFYDRSCITDGKIEKVISSNNKPFNNFTYDIIIVDEAQDMTARYFRLVCKIISDNLARAQLCVTGDQNQKIYDFKNADERFITLAHRIYGRNDEASWKLSKLSRSFRITTPMAEFVNNCMLSSKRITSEKESKYKPEYIICDCFTSEPFKILQTYLNAGYKAGDIFILAPSVTTNKGESMITKLENRIKKKLENIKVYVSNSDDEKLDNDVIKNKVVFTTFHQAKGMERKVVIVFNFDNSFFKWYFRTKNPFVCPNELYVGATRASEHIIFLHHRGEDYLPFLNANKLKRFAQVSVCSGLRVTDKPHEVDRRVDGKTEVITDLTRHLSSDTIIQCFNLLTITYVRKAKDLIKIDTKVENNDQFESVSDITGTAIPLYYELAKKRDMGIRTKLKPLKLEFLKEYEGLPYAEKVINNRFKITCIEDLLVLATLWLAYKSGFDYKIYQIPKYDWLHREDLNKCVERINSLDISPHAQFEKLVTHIESSDTMHKILEGYLDCIDGNNVYEFKCVEKLLDEHFIQVALYMYIHSISHPGCKYYLYNVLDDELCQIQCERKDLKMILNIISDEKFGEKVSMTDEEFIKKMNEHYEEHKEHIEQKEQKKGKVGFCIKSFHVEPVSNNTAKNCYHQRTMLKSLAECNVLYTKLVLNKASKVVRVEIYEKEVLLKSKGALPLCWKDLVENYTKVENNKEVTTYSKSHSAFMDEMERELAELDK